LTCSIRTDYHPRMSDKNDAVSDDKPIEVTCGTCGRALLEIQDYVLCRTHYVRRIEELEDRAAALADGLEGQEFYELMQAYRHAPLTPVADVVRNFEDVKAYILSLAAGVDANSVLAELAALRGFARRVRAVCKEAPGDNFHVEEVVHWLDAQGKNTEGI